MVVGSWVTESYIILTSLCHTSLESNDTLHHLLGVSLLLANEYEHVDDMLLVPLKNLLVLRIVLNVVVTFNAVTTLTDREDIVL